MAELRAAETPQQRKVRLEQDDIMSHTAIAADANVRTFINTINIFWNWICETFTKRYYPNQVPVKSACITCGVASRVVNGSTIHATLKLPIQYNKVGQITGMSSLIGNYLS